MDALFTQQPCTLKPASTSSLLWCTTLSNLSLHFRACDRCDTCGEYQTVTDFMATVQNQTRTLIDAQNSGDTRILSEEVRWLYWISRVRRQLEPEVKPPNNKTLLHLRPWFALKLALIEEARAQGNPGVRERTIAFLSAWHSVQSENAEKQPFILTTR